jgi:hypothetical protein
MIITFVKNNLCAMHEIQQNIILVPTYNYVLYAQRGNYLGCSMPYEGRNTI